MYGMIATWRMALEGVSEGITILKDGGSAGDALETAIRAVEDFEYYKSVGYGGLPNEEGEVELDAGWMDGDTLSVGAIAAVKDIASPVSVARALSQEEVNNLLAGSGAEKYAGRHGFERRNMLSERAKIHYHNRCLEVKEQGLKPYSGHDTVGMVALAESGSLAAATSTSGLFMKHPGRVGDSPVPGAGFYADSSIGGAAATGLGEDIMKGCLSYETVRLMGEGLSPQAACEKALQGLDQKLKARRGRAGSMSLVAMNAAGEWGCASNCADFSFVVATESLEPTVFVAHPLADGHTAYEKASAVWLEAYMKTRLAPLVRK